MHSPYRSCWPLCGETRIPFRPHMSMQTFIFSLLFPPKNCRKEQKTKFAIVRRCSEQVISIDVKMPLDPSIVASMCPRASRSRYSTIIIASNVIFFSHSLFHCSSCQRTRTHTHPNTRAHSHIPPLALYLSRPKRNFRWSAIELCVCVCRTHIQKEKWMQTHICWVCRNVSARKFALQCLNMYIYSEMRPVATLLVLSLSSSKTLPMTSFFSFTARTHIERFHETQSHPLNTEQFRTCTAHSHLYALIHIQHRYTYAAELKQCDKYEDRSVDGENGKDREQKSES